MELFLSLGKLFVSVVTTLSFLKFKLEQTFRHFKAPIILDGSVKLNINAQDRSALIIIYLAEKRMYLD